MIQLIEVIKEQMEKNKAQDVLILDIQENSTITDYYIICTGSSKKNIQAISDNVEVALKENGFNIFGKEGYNEAEWILLDLDNVILHIFDKEIRDFYNLEMVLNNPKVIYKD